MSELNPAVRWAVLMHSFSTQLPPESLAMVKTAFQLQGASTWNEFIAYGNQCGYWTGVNAGRHLSMLYSALVERYSNIECVHQLYLHIMSSYPHSAAAAGLKDPFLMSLASSQKANRPTESRLTGSRRLVDPSDKIEEMRAHEVVRVPFIPADVDNVFRHLTESGEHVEYVKGYDAALEFAKELLADDITLAGGDEGSVKHTYVIKRIVDFVSPKKKEVKSTILSKAERHATSSSVHKDK